MPASPGETLAGGVVAGIEPDGLELDIAGQRWFYELQRRLPRGYSPPVAEDSAADDDEPRRDDR